MTMMNEAVSKDNFERMEKGLPILKPKKVVVPDPPKPVMDNEITMKDIPEGYSVHLSHAAQKPIRNKDGILFIGFDVIIDLNPVAKKRGPGRPKESEEGQPEPKELKGWMMEGTFLEFVRTYRKQIDQQVIHW
jgi:hypothetical protein